MKKSIIVVLLFFVAFAHAQQQIVYNSKNLPRADTTRVYVPKNLSPGEKTPMIFLLHGYSGNYKQWDNIMDAQKYADNYRFIIVCPDGLFDSWYLNSPVKTDSQFETFFFEELWPDMMKRYNPDTSKIFISGLSMGGHGALYLFLKHPEKFRSAGSTSGVVDIEGTSTKYALMGLLGQPSGDNLNAWKAHSVVGNIAKLQNTKKTFIFDCGANDPFYKMNTELKATCDSLKIPATFISQPGAHNKAYWKGSIKQHFDFYKALLN